MIKENKRFISYYLSPADAAVPLLAVLDARNKLFIL